MSLIPTIVFGEAINETVFGETKMLVLFIVSYEKISFVSPKTIVGIKDILSLWRQCL